MKSKLVLLLSMVFVAAVIPCVGQDVRVMVNNLDLAELRYLQVEERGAEYILKMEISVENKNEYNLKLQDAKFTVSFDQAGWGDIKLGNATVVSQEIPKATSSQMTLEMVAGAKNDETVRRLFKIFNMANSHAVNPLKMYLKGDSEVGLGLQRGYVFEPGRRFQVELTYNPAVNRSFIMR
jgi:hypothetical protein